MKIKRVEIQAFKSYHHAKDGTFVFSDEAGNPVNFISIFAPNGFGKTSFCDAVDFAITHNIHRYARMKQVEKFYEAELKEGNDTGQKQLVLRNKRADTSLKTEITVEVDNRKEPFRSEYKSRSNTKVDYKYDKKRTQKAGTEFFEYAMLYQEGIDSVLRETNPEERFSKLAENEENLSEITVKRSSLIAAKNEAEREKGTVETEKTRIAGEILDYDGKKKDISTLNTHLKQVNGVLNKEEFNILDELQPFTQEQYNQLEQSAISVTGTMEELKSNASSTKSELIEHQSKLETYQAAYADKWATEQEIALINDSLNSKKSINDLEKLKALFLKEENNYADLLNKLKKNKAQVSGYFELKKTYDSDCLEQKKLKEQEAQLTLTLTSLKNEHDKLKKEITALDEQRNKQQLLLREADRTFAEITELKKSEEELVQKLGELKLQEKKLTEDIETRESIILALNRLLIESTNLSEYKAIIAENTLSKFMLQKSLFKTDSESINEKQSLLTSKKQELDQVQMHSSQLQQLIAQAHDLILHTKQSECPVCQQSYADFSALETKLKENPIYQNREQVLLEEIATLNKQLAEFEELKKNARNKFDALKSDILQQLERELTLAQDTKKGLEISCSRLGQELSKIKDDLNSLNEKVSFKDKQTYESDINKELNKLTGRLNSLSKNDQPKEDKINSTTENLDDLRTSLNAINLKIASHKINFGSYAELISLLESKKWQNLESEESLTQAFTTEIQRVSLSRQKESDSAKNTEESLRELKGKLPDKFIMSAISELEQEKDALQEKQTKLSEIVLQFERVMEDINCPSEYRQDMERVSLLITKKVKELGEKVVTYTSGISSVETAKALAKALVGTEGLTTLEKQHEHLERKEIALKDIIRELKDDKDALGDLIQSKVDAFFKTELINQLYQVIDPHPEFKNICFECKTDGDKPKLLIKAETSDGSMNVSPVLSFSSAQINVLALSIFLARALTLTDGEGNPVNCIFIDDPVQSIDSINTLSLIDLFRVLTIKFDKQIILTTHDENFHELLKKKMPADLFSSKYLRLESFGKVAVDAA